MMSEKSTATSKLNAQLQNTPVAIIGMASIFPQARNLQEYWEKIIRKADCITDVPPSRWDVDAYYDPDPRTPDKTYCKRGGFIPDIDFNPMEFGLPPNVLEATDVSQLLSLVVAKEAMEDAGYGESRKFNRERTGVILGVALARQLAMPLGARLQYPIWEKVLKSSGLSDEDTEKIVEKIKSAYLKWEENAFPGMLANVVAGRIANRLDLGGMNCVVDAACASSLGALAMAISELIEHRCDMVLTGGVDTDNSVVAYMCFSKTPALSRSQNVRPFDVDSDGMMLGEGIGMVLLKRLEDAQRDNDRIYAVIKGIGTSSDGRYKSIYAPRPEGQVRALRRAYEEAGFSPSTVSLIEAHGTGTMAGDPAEFTAINQVFSENNPKTQHIALGSVKSQIGHTKAAAGAASLIKTALALHHKILPPTINITKPNPKLNIETSPFYLNTETRPWLRPAGETPRRAGVSSFGFGGTNYHVVLEEYQSEHDRSYRLHKTAQSVLLFAPTPEQLLARCEAVLGKLQSAAGEQHYTELVDACKSLEIPVTYARIGFVADSSTEACNLLQSSIDWLKNKLQAESWQHPQGIYYRKTGIEGKVVALFSGQGSQYPEMGRELVNNFPCLRQAYGYMDSLLSKDGLQPISETVFPAPVFDPAHRNAQAETLQRTEYAQPAIGVFSVGLYKILQQAGFRPDFVAGHSFGELTALWAAEVLSDEDYFFLVKARGQAMAKPDAANFDAGAMLAIKGDVNQVEAVVKNFPNVAIANFNSSKQMVLAGAKPEIAKVQQTLNEQGYSAVLLPVSAAFHTPLVAHAQKPFAQAIEAVTCKTAKIPVYTNVTGKRYPTEPQAIQKILKEHLINLVLFKDEIENIYADGGCIFIEFGPRNILTNLVKETLGDKPHLALALNPTRQKDSDRQLREAVVQLRVAGLPLKNLDPYQVEPKTTAAQTKNVLNVRLNSANFVSEKTRTAFEKALQNGHQVTAPALGGAGEAGEEKPLAPRPSPLASPKPQIQAKLELPVNHQRILDSLENTLAQFNHHQGDILHVHEQSLNHQMEYAKTFFQLTQQQNLLFSNQKAAHQQEETKPVVVESLERSMMRFHDHQGETLRIHEEYLNHQMEYAKNFFQLIQQQYDLVITGDSPEHHAGSTEVAAPIASYQESPTAKVAAKQDSVVLATASAAVSSKELVTSPYSISSNGSKNGSSNGNGNGNGSKPAQKMAGLVMPAADLPVSVPTSLPIAPPPHHPIPDFTVLSQTLLTVVSEKTGYPVEMLELEMDMEADLGIDSIKRVEILGALQELSPDLPKPNLEELAERLTLGQIVEYMRSLAEEDTGTRGHGDAGNSESQLFASLPEAPPVPVTVDLAELSQTLLTVVSDKTGYPAEMLELEMDMEADLGIDSIKRVEILGALLELFPDLPKPNPEDLAELRTLGQIIDYMKGQAPEAEKKMPSEVGTGEIGAGLVELPMVEQITEPNPPLLNHNIRPEVEAGLVELPVVEQIIEPNPPLLDHNIQRSLVRLKVLQLPDSLEFTLPKNHIGLLTDDGSLTTFKLAQALTERGWKVVVLSFPPSLIAKQPLPEGISRVVLEDLSEEHLQQQLAAIATNYGPIAAFIHLNPASQDNQSQDIRYLEVEKALLKQVFLIAKHLKNPLNQAAQQGRSCFLTVARLDGKFGLGQETNFGAIAAGLFGLTKTLNQEWEPVFCRAVDLSPELDAERSVQNILAELHDPNRLIAEVGYAQGRATLVCEQPGRSPAPLNKGGWGDRTSSQIDRNSVFLVSGGAKGITAQSAIKLAQNYQCKFILLGRSSIAQPEPAWAIGCSSEAELKKRILEELLTKGEKPTPVMVQREFNVIASKREIAATLRAIEQAGGQAEYLSVDVTDAIALQEQLTAAVQRIGPVTGIIHGAGNLADKRIEKKTAQNFETVYAAKVQGLANLLRCIPASQLNQLVLFSSVAGFYGNVGQADYAIANEILNKSAHLIKRNYPNCHVVAINWGPWDSGMVSPELKKAFAERNIETIPIEIGTQMLVDELNPVNQQTAQVVIGSPLVYIPETLNSGLQTFRLRRKLTSVDNPFLQDHVIADRPVLPATCAIAWIANTCEQLYPGYKFFSCPNFKVLKGIVFDENLASEYVLDLKEIDRNSSEEIQFEAKIWSQSSGKIRYHFSTQLKLQRQIPPAPTYDSLNITLDENLSIYSQSLYQNGALSLFHGPSFQGVKQVLNASPEKLTMQCLLPSIGERQQGQFPVQTFNPYIVDVEIHSTWLWLQHCCQQGCLPSEIENFEQFAIIPFDETFYVSAEIRSKTDITVVADVIAHNLEGKIYSRMLGAKGTILPMNIGQK
nr:type I polyketide synthase [Chroococcidiopsis sp. CCMEE 29]